MLNKFSAWQVSKMNLSRKSYFLVSWLIHYNGFPKPFHFF
jgi:hypothetical protein